MSDTLYTLSFKAAVIFVNFQADKKITPECIIEVIKEMNQLYDVKQHNALWDFRGVLPSDDFGYEAMERIILFIENHPEVYWNPQLAILVEEGVQYGLSRMFQILTDQFPIDIRIFYDDAVAMAWVADKAAGHDQASGAAG